MLYCVDFPPQLLRGCLQRCVNVNYLTSAPHNRMFWSWSRQNLSVFQVDFLCVLQSKVTNTCKVQITINKLTIKSYISVIKCLSPAIVLTVLFCALCFTRSHIGNVTFKEQKVSYLNFTIIQKIMWKKPSNFRIQNSNLNPDCADVLGKIMICTETQRKVLSIQFYFNMSHTFL